MFDLYFENKSARWPLASWAGAGRLPRPQLVMLDRKEEEVDRPPPTLLLPLDRPNAAAAPSITLSAVLLEITKHQMIQKMEALKNHGHGMPLFSIPTKSLALVLSGLILK